MKQTGMVENMLIWHVVVYARFRCVALVLVASHQNFVMSDHRKNFFRWLLSVLFCCWNSSNSFTENNDNCIRTTERIEMGPLTLRDYVNTLEPYDPEKHGWRGEEPWRYRIRYKDPPTESIHIITEFKTNYCNGESKRSNLKKLYRFRKFFKRDRTLHPKQCSSSMIENFDCNDKTMEQLSIHQLFQTINLLHSILLKVIGIEIINKKT